MRQHQPRAAVDDNRVLIFRLSGGRVSLERSRANSLALNSVICIGLYTCPSFSFK